MTEHDRTYVISRSRAGLHLPALALFPRLMEVGWRSTHGVHVAADCQLPQPRGARHLTKPAVAIVEGVRRSLWIAVSATIGLHHNFGEISTLLTEASVVDLDYRHLWWSCKIRKEDVSSPFNVLSSKPPLREVPYHSETLLGCLEQG